MAPVTTWRAGTWVQEEQAIFAPGGDACLAGVRAVHLGTANGVAPLGLSGGGFGKQQLGTTVWPTSFVCARCVAGRPGGQPSPTMGGELSTPPPRPWVMVMLMVEAARLGKKWATLQGTNFDE